MERKKEGGSLSFRSCSVFLFSKSAMSDDSRRLQQRQPQQQPPPLAAAFASLSSAVSEARRSMASSLRPPTPPSAAAAATMSAASAASAPLVAAAAARGALKTPATGEKVKTREERAKNGREAVALTPASSSMVFSRSSLALSLASRCPLNRRVVSLAVRPRFSPPRVDACLLRRLLALRLWSLERTRRCFRRRNLVANVLVLVALSR